MSAVMADPAHDRALKDPSGGRLCRQPPCRAGRPVRSVSSCAREGGRPKAHQTGNSLPGKKVAKHAINLSGSEIHSENFQALNLLSTKFLEKARCVYLDPPYNTGEDGFLYKDAYQHSSWVSMMADRLQLGVRFLRADGVLTCS